MQKDILIDSLAELIVSDNLRLTDIQKEIAKACSRKRLENENGYFKLMYSKFEKLGYSVTYEKVKMSIYVLEKIHNGVDTVDNLITRISSSTGTTEKMIRQNMFDPHMTIYSALKYAMDKYLKEKNKSQRLFKTNEYWSNSNDEEKMELYVELEKYLYEL